MKSLPLGILCIALVLAGSLSDGQSWTFYLNAHSLIMVLGGTAAIFLFSTPSEIIAGVFREIMALFKPQYSLKNLGSDFKELMATKDLSKKSKDPLVNRAVELWRQGVSPEIFTVLLNQAKLELDQKGLDSIQALRNLSKYPPALGMTGTVMGLISLFSQLGPDSRANLGPALALALTATFFGLIVSNLAITPLADRLQVKHLRNRRHLTNVYQILNLINRSEASVIIEEEIESLGGQNVAA